MHSILTKYLVFLLLGCLLAGQVAPSVILNEKLEAWERSSDQQEESSNIEIEFSKLIAAHLIDPFQHKGIQRHLAGKNALHSFDYSFAALSAVYLSVFSPPPEFV